MTEQFSTGARSGLSDPDGAVLAVPRLPGRALAIRADPFACSVADAQADLLLLHDKPQGAAALDALQLLLRAMCASGRKVERAGLQDGRLSLSVDGIAVAFGPDRLPDRRSGVFHRPDWVSGPSRAARLGYFLYRHQGCTRLRIGVGAPPELARDVLTLVLRCAPPKAVVLGESRVVLSAAEVMRLTAPDLARLRPGKVVPRPVTRYARPGITGVALRPSAFEAGRTAPRSAPVDAMIAGTAALREQAHLRAALRPDPDQGRGVPPRWQRAVALSVLTLTAVFWAWTRGVVAL